MSPWFAAAEDAAPTEDAAPVAPVAPEVDPLTCDVSELTLADADPELDRVTGIISRLVAEAADLYAGALVQPAPTTDPALDNAQEG